ncbi:MAG: hypothetical protein EPO42_14520 [Gallionellaceae bacterium]|nr:MAG: hypothetical protein EPO42_14520 [Gallionellaceae bacterium]
MDATVPPSRRAQRVLERIVIERTDGSPPTEAEVEAVREEIAAFDELETRADRAVSSSGAWRTRS